MGILLIEFVSCSHIHSLDGRWSIFFSFCGFGSFSLQSGHFHITSHNQSQQHCCKTLCLIFNFVHHNPPLHTMSNLQTHTTTTTEPTTATTTEPTHQTIIIFACEPDWPLRHAEHRMVYELSFNTHTHPEWRRQLMWYVMERQILHYHAFVIQTGEIIAWKPDREPRIESSPGHASSRYLRAILERSDTPDDIKHELRQQTFV